MSRRDRHFADDMPEMENSASEPVSDATLLYDAAELNDIYQADPLYGDPDTTQTSFTEEEGEAILPSEIMEKEAAPKKRNPIVRFFKWIGSWRIWVKILVLALIVFGMTGAVMATTAIKEVEDVVKIMNEGAEDPMITIWE